MNRWKAALPLVGIGALMAGGLSTSASSQAGMTAVPTPGPVACVGMKGAFPPDGTVTEAEWQAEGSFAVMPLFGAKIPTPPHCLVRGEMARRTGVDGKPYAIGFELRLPAQWNGRFLFQGGGGHDGRLFPATGLFGAGKTALDRGFAVVTTDGGHRDSGVPGESGDYGNDPQARVDYAYNALDRTTVAAKELVARYYGDGPSRSYFTGCSNGGRQAMMASQRFPDYFDGIVAGAPGFRLTELGAAGVFRMQKLAPLAERDATGEPKLATAVSMADLKLVADAVVRQCDGQDGLVDGVISRAPQCSFKVETLACKSGQTEGCLSARTMTAVKALMAPTTDRKGNVIYPAAAWDSGIGSPMWYGTRVTSPTAANPRLAMRDQFVAFFTPPRPDTDVYQFDMNEWVPGTAEMSAMTNPVSVDLDRFRARGGKILFYHGVSDQIMTPLDLIAYYDKLAKRYGGDARTGEFARMFMAPGMLHCMGGAGFTSFDALGAVMDWVENGKAPDRLLATNPQDFPGSTRPLCPWPTYAHYTGGDPKDPASFACQRLPRR